MAPEQIEALGPAFADHLRPFLFCCDYTQTFDLFEDYCIQEHAAAKVAALPGDDLGTVGVVDETGTRKKGAKTPGVRRQWCGELGKKENCTGYHQRRNRASWESRQRRGRGLPAGYVNPHADSPRERLGSKPPSAG